MKKLYYLVIWFVVTLVFQNCSGCLFSECLENKYAFTEPVQFYPESKILHVGDTLWLNSRFSCEKMLDVNSGDTVSFCEIPEIKNSIFIGKFEPDSAEYALAALKDFLIFDVHGKLIKDAGFNPDRTFYVEYAKSYPFYEVLIGISPKVAGKFGIYVSDPPGVLLSETSNGCDNRGDFNFEITNTDRHLEILYEFLDGKPISEAITVNYYCFEVVN